MKRYKEIKAALDAGPTPGPWASFKGKSTTAIGFGGGNGNRPPSIVTWMGFDGNNLDHKQNQINAAYIAACDPDTINQLWGDLNKAIGLLNLLVDAVYIQAESTEIEPILKKHLSKAVDFIEYMRSLSE